MFFYSGGKGGREGEKECGGMRVAAKQTSCSAARGAGVMASFVASPNARASWQRFYCRCRCCMAENVAFYKA